MMVVGTNGRKGIVKLGRDGSAAAISSGQNFRFKFALFGGNCRS
jgi:hypothetical protein